MKATFLAMALLGSSAALPVLATALAGQAPGASDGPGVPISHRTASTRPSSSRTRSRWSTQPTTGFSA
jgi:hypothetical protein